MKDSFYCGARDGRIIPRTAAFELATCISKCEFRFRCRWIVLKLVGYYAVRVDADDCGLVVTRLP